MNIERSSFKHGTNINDNIYVPSREPCEDELVSIRKKIDTALQLNNKYKEKLENTCNEQKISLKDLTEKVIIFLRKEKNNCF